MRYVAVFALMGLAGILAGGALALLRGPRQVHGKGAKPSGYAIGVAVACLVLAGLAVWRAVSLY